MKSTRGTGRIFQRGFKFWIAYFLKGKEYRQSAHTADQKVAERFLRAKIKEVHAAQIGAKPFVTPQAQRLTVNDLLTTLERDLRLREKFSPSIESNLKHLKTHFGDTRATELNAEHIGSYIENLLADGYAKSSVNRHTQLLHQAYKLAIRQRRLNEMPYVQHLSENGNTRQGFFSEQEIQKVAVNLPEYLADVVLFAFYSAWRRGEILSLTWADLAGDELRLRPENSKNGQGRTLVLAGELVNIIERRRKAARGLLIFHSGDGRAIVDFRKSWKTATKLAGLQGRIFHDLRRSGVRNMIRAGVPEHVAMTVSGHRTHSMLNRYNIISQADQRNAVERTAQYLKENAEAAAQVPAPVTTMVQ